MIARVRIGASNAQLGTKTDALRPSQCACHRNFLPSALRSEYENTIFETKKLPAFIEYQRTHESEILKPGTGFHLVESLLKLNRKESESPRRVEVMIFSRNHPDVYLRVSHSIELHRLDITRAFLTGGEPLDRYLKAYKVDLFLSAQMTMCDRRCVTELLPVAFTSLLLRRS